MQCLVQPGWKIAERRLLPKHDSRFGTRRAGNSSGRWKSTPVQEVAVAFSPNGKLIGTENDKALESYKENEAEIPGSKVQVRLLEGLNHEQEFNNIEQVLPVILDFIKGSAK